MNVEEAGLEVISALEDLDKSPIDVTKVSDDDPLLEIYYMLSRRNTTVFKLWIRAVTPSKILLSSLDSNFKIHIFK